MHNTINELDIIKLKLQIVKDIREQPILVQHRGIKGILDAILHFLFSRYSKYERRTNQKQPTPQITFSKLTQTRIS